MFRFLSKFHLERYVNTKFILCIDLCVSFAASLFVLAFLQLFIQQYNLISDFSLFWLLGTIVACGIWFTAFGTHHTVIRHSTLREVGRFTGAIIGKELTLTLLLLLFNISILPYKLIIGIAVIDGFISLGMLILIRVSMIWLRQSSRSIASDRTYSSMAQATSRLPR